MSNFNKAFVIFISIFSMPFQSATAEPFASELLETSNHESIYKDFAELWKDGKNASPSALLGRWKLISFSGGDTAFSACSKLYPQITNTEGLVTQDGNKVYLDFELFRAEKLNSLSTKYSESGQLSVKTKNFPALNFPVNKSGPFSTKINQEGLNFSLLQYHDYKKSRLSYFDGTPIRLEGEDLRANLSFTCRLVKSQPNQMICKHEFILLRPAWLTYPSEFDQCSSDSKVFPLFSGYTKVKSSE